MSKLPQRFKAALRLIAGSIVGLSVCAGAAGFLFNFFEALKLDLGEDGPVGPIAWGAYLAAWVLGAFVGQFVAANVSGKRGIIWFIAAAHAGMLLYSVSVIPHAVFLVGALVPFAVALRLKDSDLLSLQDLAASKT